MGQNPLLTHFCGLISGHRQNPCLTLLKGGWTFFAEKGRRTQHGCNGTIVTTTIADRKKLPANYFLQFGAEQLPR